jgi:hypothetical protein
VDVEDGGDEGYDAGGAEGEGECELEEQGDEA